MICCNCKQEKISEQFPWRNKAKGKRHYKCKTCTKEYSTIWCRENKKRHYELVKAAKESRREFNIHKLLEYFSEHPCLDCAETDPIVLEFDHRSNKEYNISYMIQDMLWENIEKEIAKCDVRCSNCHKRKTARDQNWRMLKIIEVKGRLESQEHS